MGDIMMKTEFSAGNSASREPRKLFLNICNGAFHFNQSCVLLAKLARTQSETEKKVKHVQAWLDLA